MSQKLIRIVTVCSALALAPVLVALVPAQAQNANSERVNVRGHVISLTDDVLTVKSREGRTIELTMASGCKIAGVARAQVSDIKPGDYVGIASLPEADGGDGALEVLIFPPALRGSGEGSHGWDLKPHSSMTNATVANAVKGVNGRTVTVTYQGKEKKISIPDGTPVVTLASATAADLVAGAVVYVPAMKGRDGALTAQQVLVGTNGVIPPM